MHVVTGPAQVSPLLRGDGTDPSELLEIETCVRATLYEYLYGHDTAKGQGHLPHLPTQVPTLCTHSRAHIDRRLLQDQQEPALRCTCSASNDI